MTFMIALHVITAVLFLGPVTVATSMFPAAIRSGATQQAVVLNRISRVYGVLSALVPALGLGLMMSNTAFFKEGRFHAAIALSIVAWIVLLALILPLQKKLLAASGYVEFDDEQPTHPDTTAAAAKPQLIAGAKKLSAFSGVFALCWLLAAIMMFI